MMPNPAEPLDEADAPVAPPRAAPARGAGVLLVANLPDGPLVGGVEVGVQMIMSSALPERHALRLFNTDRRRDPNRPLRERLAYQLGRCRELAAAIRRDRPHTVHVKSTVGINYWQGIVYGVIALALGRRFILQLHGGDLDTWYEAQGRLQRWAIRSALRLPAEVLVLSRFWQSFVTQLAPGVRTRVIPNGVELERALPRTRRHGAEMRVLALGALGTRKGHPEIVEAAALLKGRPVRFVFAGADEVGGEERELRARARALGVEDAIEFAGPADVAAKWRWLSECDVLLLPSRGENMPNAVLEAMAAELPVVCTPIGAMPEMLEDGGALFVPVGDPHAIAEALLRLQQAPELRADMGRKNRLAAEQRFSFTAVAAALDQLYSEGGSPPPPTPAYPRPEPVQWTKR